MCSLVIIKGQSAQDHLSRPAAEWSLVETAPEWTALFDRDSGWTGSDACYSVPLSGYDAPAGPNDDRTLFLFGDTFIGEVNENGARVNSVMIRNTMGILQTKQPHPDSIQFHWNTNAQDQAEALFKADTPQSEPGDWIWPMDGIAIDDIIYVFGIRIREDGFFFQVVGTTLISFSLNEDDQIIHYEHIDAPLYYNNDQTDTEIVLGQAIMPMTENSGNPNPDGYIYVFGPNSHLFIKDMVVARVLPENISNFSEWQFWDGSSWGSQIEDCASLTDSISQEFSVTPLDDGRFVVSFVFENSVYVRFADQITGPYGAARRIYDCPEVNQYPETFVYNGKAHPHLSGADELLISYNVNTYDWAALFNIADIYRPRFIHYYWRDEPSSFHRARQSYPPEASFMLSNYPNPFNQATNIRIQLSPDHDGMFNADLDVFDLSGRLVKNLFSGLLPAGLHNFTWNGDDENNRPSSSGVYLVQFSAAQKRIARKILLLR